MRAAEQWADRLGGAPIAFIHKTRDPSMPNQVVANRVVGEVAGRACILADDMIDTGGSIVKAAELLYENGAADVVIAATHAIFSEPAADRLKNSRVREVIVTNTLPIRPEQQFDKLTVHLDRADDRPRDQGGLRGRFGDQPVRRPQLTAAGTNGSGRATGGKQLWHRDLQLSWLAIREVYGCSVGPSVVSREVLYGHVTPSTLFARKRLSERLAYRAWPADQVTEQLGVSRATVHKWLRRYAEAGKTGLVDRSSRPRRMPAARASTSSSAC